MLLLVLLLTGLNPAPVQAAPIEVVDDTGVTLTLDKPAERIIALYGAYNELLLALDARDLLVARTVADAHLPELAGLPAIGTHMRPNAELIVAQKPDLVLQLAGRREALLQTEALRKLGINVLTFEMDSFDKMFDVLEKLGRLTGREQKAAGLIRDWRARLATLRARHAGEKPVRVFYEVRYPNLLAAGQGSIVNEIIAVAGGENVVADDKKLVRFNEEALILADPDAYLTQKGPMNPDPQPLSERAHYRDLRAVRTGRVLVVDEDRFARPGPRAVEAAEELERWLHP
nr:ABC transporter substrate-binding protein [Desulfovibrio sp. 6_1_46AFAA]